MEHPLTDEEVDAMEQESFEHVGEAHEEAKA